MPSNEEAARQLAQGFRTEYRLGLEPLRDLFELVHATVGVDVLSFDAGQDEHGLTASDPASGVVVVAVGTTSHPMRQRSSLAHELAHVICEDYLRPSVAGERSPAEIRADAFARHLLLPLDAVRARITGTAVVAMEHLSGLVQEFEVSSAIAAIQLRGAGLLSRRASEEWARVPTRSLAAEYGWLSQYEALAAASSQPRAPQALMARAARAYRRRELGLLEMALWYQRSPEDLRGAVGEPEPAPGPPELLEDEYGAVFPVPLG